MNDSVPEQVPDLSLVIPIYNEEENLKELVRRIHDALQPSSMDYEVLFVNDGSSDGSLAAMRKFRQADPRIKIVDLSRNFGHQVALSAGLDHAAGCAVVVMDGDLQDPPELIPTLVERWQEGYEVVYTVRNQRKEGLAKRFAYATFYRLLQRITDIDIPLDSGDFCLMDRRAVDLLVRLPERNRFLRGLRSWLGFRQVAVEYDRPARFAGEPKYTAAQLVTLAANGIFSFSEAPLRLTRNAGLVITIGSALIAAWTLFKRLILYEVVPGFATLAILVLFFGGVQLITVGILGEYIARIYSEVKGRPLYIVKATEGVEVRDTSHR